MPATIRKVTILLIFSLWGLSPALIWGQSLEGKVVSVTDGDTVKILTAENKQIRVRLAQIDTPEKAQPWGNKAKQALSKKIYAKQVSIDVVTTDRYGRTVGTIWFDGRDINRELVREGHAWVYRKYAKDKSLFDDESYARAQGLGLWSLPESQRQAPWKWRKSNK